MVVGSEGGRVGGGAVKERGGIGVGGGRGEEVGSAGEPGEGSGTRGTRRKD